MEIKIVLSVVVFAAALLQFIRFILLHKHREPSRMLSLVLAAFFGNFGFMLLKDGPNWLPLALIALGLGSFIAIWSNLRQTHSPRMFEYTVLFSSIWVAGAGSLLLII